MPRRILSLGPLVLFSTSEDHNCTMFDKKNQEHFTLPSTTSDWQSVRSQTQNVCKSKAWRLARKRENSLRHNYFHALFSTTFRWRIFLKATESISWCPKSLFPSKTQNQQIARISPSISFILYFRLSIRILLHIKPCMYTIVFDTALAVWK